MATIGIDIDDTLYDFGGLAREEWGRYAKEMGDKSLQRGAYCAWPEWRSPADVVDLSVWMEIIDRCHADPVILSQEPFPGAINGLHILADRYDLIYISTRKPEATEATAEWLFEYYDFPDGDLICTHDSKLPYLYDSQYIIDDRPRTLVEFTYSADWDLLWPERRRHGFGLLKDYNRALTDLTRVSLAPSWDLLMDYIAAEGVLSHEGASY